MGARKAISKKVRFDVFKRDSFTCQYCGAEAPGAVLHVDHILPVAKGGGNALTNLVTACSNCNLGKGASKLNDDSAITRQKQQLNELNERREQLEMLQQWHSGLADLQEQEFQAVYEHWQSEAGWDLSDSGIRTLRRVVKKHGYQKAVKGIDMALERHCEYDESGQSTSESVGVALNAIEKAIKFSALPAEEKKILYINGIVRNRVSTSYSDQDALKASLKSHVRRGYSLDDAEEYAKSLNVKRDFWEFIDWLDGEGVSNAQS